MVESGHSTQFKAMGNAADKGIETKMPKLSRSTTQPVGASNKTTYPASRSVTTVLGNGNGSGSPHSSKLSPKNGFNHTPKHKKNKKMFQRQFHYNDTNNGGHNSPKSKKYKQKKLNTNRSHSSIYGSHLSHKVAKNDNNGNKNDSSSSRTNSLSSIITLESMEDDDEDENNEKKKDEKKEEMQDANSQSSSNSLVQEMINRYNDSNNNNNNNNNYNIGSKKSRHSYANSLNNLPARQFGTSTSKSMDATNLLRNRRASSNHQLKRKERRSNIKQSQTRTASTGQNLNLNLNLPGYPNISDTSLNGNISSDEFDANDVDAMYAIMGESDIKQILESVDRAEKENSPVSEEMKQNSIEANEMKSKNDDSINPLSFSFDDSHTYTQTSSATDTSHESKKGGLLMNNNLWIDNIIEDIYDSVLQESDEFKFVPKENRVKDLDNVFEYVKQLGSGGSVMLRACLLLFLFVCVCFLEWCLTK